jgi:hypothetical protein
MTKQTTFLDDDDDVDEWRSTEMPAAAMATTKSSASNSEHDAPVAAATIVDAFADDDANGYDDAVH